MNLNNHPIIDKDSDTVIIDRSEWEQIVFILKQHNKVYLKGKSEQ